MNPRTRVLFGALVALMLIAVPLAMPASADHTHPNPPIGHWGNGFSPELVLDSSPGYGVHFANVQDAAGYWQDTGFINGFRNLFSPVFENNGCGEKGGAVKVCEVSVFDSRVPPGYDGYTYNHWVCDLPSPCNYTQVHIYAVTIFVRAGLSDYRRQQIYRHEMGHAVGLGHTLDPNCVMRSDANVPLGYRCQHDIDSMRDLYYYHRTG